MVVVVGSVVVVGLDVVDVENVVVVVVVVVVGEPDAAIATHVVTSSVSDVTAAPRRKAQLRRSTCLPPDPVKGPINERTDRGALSTDRGI